MDCCCGEFKIIMRIKALDSLYKNMTSIASSYSNVENVEAFNTYNSRYWFFKQTNATLISLISFENCGIYVDLGCGTGIGIASLLEKNCQFIDVVGIDSSPYMLEIARQRYRRNSRVRFIEDKAENVTRYLNGDSVDIAICNSAFWQMDTEVVLRQFSRVLKEGGIFIFNIVEECLPEMRKIGTKGLFLQKMFQWINEEFGIIPNVPWKEYNQYNLPKIYKEMRALGLEIVYVKTLKLYRGTEELLSFLCMPRQSYRLFPGLPQDIRVEILQQSIERMKGDVLEIPFEFVTYIVVRKVHEI